MDDCKLNNSIITGDFESGYIQIKNLSSKELIDKLLPYVYENPSMIYYGFLSFLISKNSTSENHYVTSVILTTAMNYFAGAYDLAYFHAQQSINISPNDLSYQEFILLFHSIPDKLLSDEKALMFAKNILAQKEDNINALKIIEKLEK